MTNFLHWRKMTWVLVLFCAAIVVWPGLGIDRPVVAAALWIAATIGLGAFWLATQPLFRQGRGLRALLPGTTPGTGA
jgi:hypothetical protein